MVGPHVFERFKGSAVLLLQMSHHKPFLLQSLAAETGTIFIGEGLMLVEVDVRELEVRWLRLGLDLDGLIVLGD